MTDKSFGDHHNRNVVKNPLLSTAVTGLSIEDLTHNAVLLPVSLSQEVITRPEQNRSQNTTLEYTDNAVSIYPAGDANANIYPPQYPPTTPPNTTYTEKHPKPHETYEKPVTTVSKASVKTEDDFDVNEYFARLHGTRYVSAPLNSTLKEDKNANLEATEENLEEINLNEPEKQENVQQSLTADIAQNFSQLPTVLPQVASAMFSSFSNMLQNRKSREPTPDVSSGYQEVQFERPSVAKEVKEVLPPPKDPPKEMSVPPNVGTSNYRLLTRKKYAQIPGLSSRDTAPAPFQPYSQTSNQNIPQYFVPGTIPNEQNVVGQQNIQDIQNFNIQSRMTENKPNYFTPATDLGATEELQINTHNVPAQNIPDLKTSSTDIVFTASNVQSSQAQLYNQDSSQSVLPPPPMFANQPRRDSQTGAGKSFLPPSVARRIGANHPIIKQTQQIPAFTENIFVPAPVDSSQNTSETIMGSAVQPPSIFSPSNIPFNAQMSQPPSSIPSSLQQFAGDMAVTSGPPPIDSVPGVPMPPVQPIQRPQETGSWPSIFPPDSSIPAAETRSEVSGPQMSIPMQSSIAPPPFFATTKNAASSTVPSMPPNMSSSVTSGFSSNHAQASSFPPSIFTPTSSAAVEAVSPASVAMFPCQSTTMPPQIFTPSSNFECSNNLSSSAPSQQGVLPPPPTSLNPNAMMAEIKEFPPINEQFAPTPEPPKPVPEPPKTSETINYRMTKKRPQYYAGPIGVGAISNNVKPVIAPVNTGSFHGALFTPQQGDNTDQAAQIGHYAEQTPFDISRPVENTYSNVAVQPQAQDYNTAFDMSRPTTETYNEPKQEPSGFGLLGSLKSKLGALDINKIQNTVTTFFDPAYNDTKKDTSFSQETATYGQQQYGQYGNPSSNFEIFVPKVEVQQQGYSYSYQPYQNPYDNNQTQNEYDVNQGSRHYYQSSTQNVENYFSDADMHRYQAPVATYIPDPNKTATVNQEIIHNKGERFGKRQEEMHATRQPDIELQRSYSIRPPYERRASQSLEMPETLPQIDTTKAIATTTDVKQPEISDTSKTVTDASTFFHSMPPPTDFLSSGNRPITDNAALSFEQKASVHTQNTETDVSNTKEIKNIFSQEPPKTLTENFQSEETLNQLHTQNIINKFSADSAHSFFDNPASQIDSKKIVLPENIGANQLNIDDRNIACGAAASFFDSPPKEKAVQRVNKDIGLPENVDFEITEQSKLEEEVLPKNVLDDINAQDLTSLQSNPSNFFSSLNPGDSKIQSIFSNVFDFGKPETKEQQGSEVITDWPVDTRPLSSAPLFGLSTMLANKTKELHDLETEMKNMTVQDSVNETSYFESLKTEFDTKDDVTELNICKTCEQVSKPEEWEREETNNLTSQLIENITSPIQLSNPVEVPLTESAIPADDALDDFGTTQCEEISHITEETIETIQVQTATELLDDETKMRDYGWSENVTYPSKPQEERDYTFEEPTGLEQHNYSLPVNPNAIGFFGSSALYENIPDKLRTDFESQENVTRVLPRQMSTPSAPTEEDDAKSEALDVHSIEQDASKDFPIFEEFVIEPDDDDDETKNVGQEHAKVDSFSSRVDEYKKKEEGEVFSQSSLTFQLTSTTSPSIMPSYFDTGNYAADTHYKNSLSSPTANFLYGTQNLISIPSGFEDNFQKRLTTLDPFADKTDEPFIPDTSTQTRFIDSPTFSTANQNITDTCVTTASRTPDQYAETVSLPDFKSVFGAKRDPKQEASSARCLSQHSEPEHKTSKEVEDFLFLEKRDDSFHNKKEEIVPAASLFGVPKFNPEPRQAPLPDPMNFFASSSAENIEKSDTQDTSLNRLASYFSSPEKTDHTKSFFELTQSENHYRHKPDQNVTNTTLDDLKTNANNTQNIPQDQYVTNLNIMRDLTSIQQTEFKPEQIVRTVNYFTIEYDNERLINDLIKTEPHKNDIQFVDGINKNINIDDTDDNKLLATLNTCKHCCDLTLGHVENCYYINHEILTDFKVKKCMDGNSGSKNNNNMENKDNTLEQKTSVTVNFENSVNKDEGNDGVSIASEVRTTSEYVPVRHHWFYRIDLDGKSNWRGFSVADSQALENAYQSPDLNDSTVVATDGGRYDVNVNGRLRMPVYWSDNPTNVRRCSWFYKGTTDARYVPYTEAVAAKLEEEYRHGVTTGEWHRRMVLPNNEMVVMHGPAVMVHFLQAQTSDAFSTPPQSTMRPRVVRRGTDESEIEDVEPSSIDHLLLLCHGVGSACDMRFRNVEEVVDDFRATSLQLTQSHYKEAYDSGRIGRVEVLPISWHATLHSGETGVDKRLARVTLDSIPRLRNFTNDTVLDVLFYTSPVFCQTIINTVCAELNRIYNLFCERNPSFKGGVSLGGHSLGSVIIYDLLCHQIPVEAACANKRYVSGAAGTGQPSVQYPALDFQPVAMYALGSPIAIFECIRGVDLLGPDFSLPTCKNFFNIFHPYDPIAYRLEPLINPLLRDYKPFLIPHHKGRKRMHLELKDTMARVGADLKQKLVESLRSTWSSMWRPAAPAGPSPAAAELEKVVEEEFEKEPLTEPGKEELTVEEVRPEWLGRLNAGRRVDYVLQEAPFEMINEYLFAMSSHVCYWESEDTMLLMLREIYDSLGVRPDSSVPQQSLVVERTRTLQDDSITGTTDIPSTSKGPPS